MRVTAWYVRVWFRFGINVSLGNEPVQLDALRMVMGDLVF
jgi:hypothetical protein